MYIIFRYIYIQYMSSVPQVGSFYRSLHSPRWRLGHMQRKPAWCGPVSALPKENQRWVPGQTWRKGSWKFG